MYRQGDVLIVRKSAIEPHERSVEIPRDAGRVVLAYGEVTGHAHAIDDATAHLYATATDDRLLVIDGVTAALSHEEHATIVLPHGAYVVRRQREFVATDVASHVVDD